MRKFIAASLAALTFAGALATGAEASDRRRRHRNNNDAAVAAGIAGLMIGAALASDHDRGYRGGYYYRDRYYGDGYYYGNGYYPRSYGYYEPRYYYGPPAYAYDAPRYRRPHCRTVTRWDPYYGGYYRVRRCW